MLLYKIYYKIQHKLYGEKNLATRAKTALIKVDRALRQLSNASIDILKKYLITVSLLCFYEDQKYGEWIIETSPKAPIDLLALKRILNVFIMYLSMVILEDTNST